MGPTRSTSSTSDGNIGVGTQTPNEQLHVKLKMRAQGALCLGATGNCITDWSQHKSIAMVDGANQDLILRMNPTYAGNVRDPVLRMQGTTNSPAEGFELWHVTHLQHVAHYALLF